MTTAHGPFEVKVTPQPAVEHVGDPAIGRMALSKQFHGDLEASSAGEMLGARNAAGSGGYVAMERVVGTLHGKRGTFILQHSSTMTRGTPTQSVTVVPDSGTDELTGLTGSMVIDIAAGAHSYRFEYSL